MSRRLPIWLLCLLLFGFARPQPASGVDDPGASTRQAWLYFDGPLWDIADEGLPFRFTLALPSDRDLLSRLLGATEARWTLAAGYVKVYNSYDATTRIFKNPGGHAAFVSAGRQFRWHLPPLAGALTPRFSIEFGLNVASRPFPADGTRTNLKVVTGLEWIRPLPGGNANWCVGIFWPHYSNANLFPRNAGYDGLALRFGRTVAF